MLNILKSKETSESPSFRESKREKGEDNLEWLQRHLPTTTEGVHILLIGGRDRMSFRLRVAQSQLRDDLSPSHWSHVAMLDQNGDDLRAGKVTEISLEPRGGFGMPTEKNGVQEGTLSGYRKRAEYPNMAVMTLPIDRAELAGAIKRFQGQRAVLDATELIVIWLAYLWGAGRTANPLLDSRGVPSAAMLETIIAAVGYDITPSLESRASCPEAIWQAAKWWHGYYEGREVAAPTGAWVVDQRL